jgi:hypothetical protein
VPKTTSDPQRPLGGFHDHETCCAIGPVGTFTEKGCKIYLPSTAKSAGTWICLEEKPYRDRHSFHDDKLCDLMFAWQQATGAQVLTAPLELKGGGVDVSHVRDQLQAGAKIIEDLLTGIKNASILPVLVHQPFKTAERRTLDRQRVTFRGKQYRIFPLKSGNHIDTLLW